MIKADCFRFRVDQQQADRIFVKWYLNSPLARRVINRGSHGQTRIRLNLANAKRIPTPVPSVEEQEHLGRVVQAIHDRGVEEARRLGQLSNLKTALSQGLLSGRIAVKAEGDW